VFYLSYVEQVNYLEGCSISKLIGIGSSDRMWTSITSIVKIMRRISLKGLPVVLVTKIYIFSQELTSNIVLL
jgi:hypothetical protein